MLCNIRRIHSGEAAHLRDIRLRALADSPRAFGGTFDADSERPSAYWEELATAWSDGDSGAAFVLEADGAWVGIAAGVRRFDQLGFVAEPGTVMLGWMWVAPKARRGGLGVQLTGEVVAWAADTGAREVHLWVTRGNEEALSLYRRAGFSPVDEHKPLASDASHDIERMVLTLGRSSQVTARRQLERRREGRYTGDRTCNPTASVACFSRRYKRDILCETGLGLMADSEVGSANGLLNLNPPSPQDPLRHRPRGAARLRRERHARGRLAKSMMRSPLSSPSSKGHRIWRKHLVKFCGRSSPTFNDPGGHRAPCGPGHPYGRAPNGICGGADDGQATV